MSEWNQVVLDDVSSKIGDGLHGTPTYDDKGLYSFINGNNLLNGRIVIKPETKRITEEEYLKILKPLDDSTILISINGTIGNVAKYRDELCALGKSACYINLDTNLVDRDFFYYECLSDNFQSHLQNVATGTTIPNVPLKGIRAYKFNLPPLPEQKAIASVLSSLDDKIDLLHRQNKTLEAMAETLFRQWFIEDETIAEVVVSELIEFNPKRSLSKGTDAIYLEMAGLSTQSFNATGYYRREFSSGTKFIQQDTLLARITPCLENGKAGYVTFLRDNEVGWGSTEYIVMRPKAGLHPLMAYVLCRNQEFKDYAESCMEGSSGRQRVNVDHLKDFTIGKPSDEVIQQFNNYLESIESKLIYNSKQIQTLENLRDTLLPKLMSGEVRVQYQTEEVA